MDKLTIYEPAMCCSTGVCGPSVDVDLIRITSVSQQIRKLDGKQLVRYNLTSNPNSFVRNQNVTKVMQEKGVDCLPVTVLNNETIVKINEYPTNKEISEWLELRLEEAEVLR
ncbi:arsenite efflux transporter metallochaperone ArsD [Carnobacterium sp. ISL-102]|uniref:arsenite efflux transporter metallochaperone ArsD n=1 Tax=Carnobacterium sp. ISL-102 TaxID=2819142 RepID=UPI001BE65897|nr:arsenite efflux transporter metallochaperone ArsD [Carnobacterium sp. ISL-102]MBT2731767.1 arsenite efflux transporter metallochaperone ArsD [Carnobacterium sp. ISL-102]